MIVKAGRVRFDVTQAEDAGLAAMNDPAHGHLSLTSRPIPFGAPFSSPPEVVIVSLAGFTSWTSPVRLRTNAKGWDANCFTVEIDVDGGVVIDSIDCSWVALSSEV